jgi:poly-gamma-glutamate synthase PgsB/CapB
VTLPAALALLILALVGLGIAEYALHARSLASIPIRIHVNGTRGKSSIVRLVAAAMRAHGIKVFAKTTGSLPRLIAADGTELPVHRPGRTNVIEQLRIVAIAAREGAEAIVLECMALQPALQSLCELKMVRSTHGVISNAWPDHLDVMGPDVTDVALALAGTTPIEGSLFTAEREHLATFEAACRDRGSQLIALGPAEIESVRDDELDRFPYLEHKENVCLALAVTHALGIPRDVALAAMQRARPDVGALREFPIDFFGRRVAFVNGFAANDPVASERIWRLSLDRHPGAVSRIMVINCRLDRPDRSRQLGQALVDWPRADRYLLIGTGTYALARTAASAGLPAAHLIPCEGKGALDVFEEIMGVCGRTALVVGAGNIAGVGLELVRLFENRADPPETRDGGKADAA